jgi:hypothetical protein
MKRLIPTLLLLFSFSALADTIAKQTKHLHLELPDIAEKAEAFTVFRLKI